jgi:tryptophan-rich sensory protein
MNTSNADPILIVTPIILSWITSYLTGGVSSNDYKKAWFQPPGWVFGLVWTALYIMFGFLLYESKRQVDYFTLGLVIGVLFLTYCWQFFFSYLKNYKLAIINLLLIFVAGLILFVRLFDSEVVDNTTFGYGYIMIYAPFLAWIIFALLLSTQTFPKKSKMKI